MSGFGRRAMIGGAAATAGGVVGSAMTGTAFAAGSGHEPGGDGPGGHGGGHGGRRATPGADRAAADGWSALRGRKVGVITNPTGVLQSTLGSIVDAMVASRKVNVVGVFGPEHGFRGTAQAGESEDTYVDQRTGVTVYDAYGADADKFASLFTTSGVEVVVFDIQDVGARFYTYIWTLYEAMIAAARKGLAVIILDRPNPVGGTARGPLLRPGYTSGVGEASIVQAHGMTAGELARFYNGEFLPTAAGKKITDLKVITVSGWQPDELFAETGLPWIMPSPNMPTPDTALLYNGTCLFEATNLSEGRGTTRPFELIGAPYVDYRWAAALTRTVEQRKLTGVRFREAYFTPTFSKNANKVCGGVQVHLTDPHRVNAIAVATFMLTTLRDLYDDFGWRDGDGPGNYWIDLLTGSDRFRSQLEAGDSAESIMASWRQELADFDRRRQPYLLYRRSHR